MSIIITNITKEPREKGEHEYQVYVNRKPLFKFKHTREHSIATFFHKAASAALSYWPDELARTIKKKEIE